MSFTSIPRTFGRLLVAARLQVLQVIPQKRLDDGAAHPQAGHLDQQALAQVARPDADRIELLDPLQHPLASGTSTLSEKPSCLAEARRRVGAVRTTEHLLGGTGSSAGQATSSRALR